MDQSISRENGLLRIEVSHEAYNELHARFRNEKAAGNANSKGSIAVALISSGMKSSENISVSPDPLKKPSPGGKLVQIKKDDHGPFLVKLDEFANTKNFYSRHFAARYCLYKELGLSVLE